LLSASSKNTIQDLVKDLQFLVYNSNNSNDKKISKSIEESSFTESKLVKNKIKRNIRNIFEGIKEKPESEKVEVLNS